MWEPLNGIDSAASRDAQRRAELEEVRWASEKQAAVKDARVAEARDYERKEKQRKAQLLGAENVYRTSRVRGPLVPVPALLLQTRHEEEAARRVGMPTAAPKQYQFIKEALDALEKAYNEKEQTARQVLYERNRRRLNLDSGTGDTEAEAEAEEDIEQEDLRARLAKMSEEEFKALAMARKARADSEVGVVSQGSAPPHRPMRPHSSKGGKPKALEPKDDPDYRR
uniref:Uncharacterized protein n=1 Tax=Coccolithus braarudii TaxID=221442 RepID=A0A7S0LII1_9EUKA